MISASSLLPAVAGSPAASSEAGATTGEHPQRSKIAKDFEAMFLRQALEDMLLSQNSGVFGNESAGGIWRSMMADQLANVLAEKGTLGLSQSFLTSGSSELKGDQK